MEKLFVYGTFLNKDIQAKVFGRILEGESTRLKDYCISDLLINGAMFPRAIYSPGDYVNGKTYSVTSEELEKADLYEGDEYVRNKKVLDDNKTLVWVYLKK